MASKSVQNC
jgi:hypothetical protein